MSHAANNDDVRVKLDGGLYSILLKFQNITSEKDDMPPLANEIQEAARQRKEFDKNFVRCTVTTSSENLPRSLATHATYCRRLDNNRFMVTIAKCHILSVASDSDVIKMRSLSYMSH
jgi:hypothetical protein